MHQISLKGQLDDSDLRASLRELPSHAALRSLTAEQRDTLVALVRREVAKHTEKEEL